MTTTRIQLLGWLEHCEREHPGKGTPIPTWLCSMDALYDEVGRGTVEEIGIQPIVPRMGMVSTIYGLTDKGRQEFYSSLPTPADV